MDYSKVDAPLASAVDKAANPDGLGLSVFIHTATPPDEAQVRYLKGMGVVSATVGRKVFTATLSASAIEQIADQNWVRYLKLGSGLRTPAW